MPQLARDASWSRRGCGDRWRPAGTASSSRPPPRTTPSIPVAGRRRARADRLREPGRPRADRANLRAAGVDPTGLGELLLPLALGPPGRPRVAEPLRAAHPPQRRRRRYLDRGDQRLIGAPLHGPDYDVRAVRRGSPRRRRRAHSTVGDRGDGALPARAHVDSTLSTVELAGLRVGVCGDTGFGPDELGAYRIGVLRVVAATTRVQSPIRPDERRAEDGTSTRLAA